MERCGALRTTAEPYGVPLSPVELREALHGLTEFCGTQWSFKESCAISWSPLESYKAQWSALESDGFLWSSMELYGIS